MIILSACKYTYLCIYILLQRYSSMHVIENDAVYPWGTLVLHSSFINNYMPFYKTFIDRCYCLEDIYGWVWLLTPHLWVDVLF